MRRLKADDLHKALLFYMSQVAFKGLAEKQFRAYRYLTDAVVEGVFNPNKSIVDNVNEFIANATLEMKLSTDFVLGVEEFKKLLKSLDEETLDKFYNTKLIDYILEQKLIPYEQVDVTKMYFTNSHVSEEEKLAFLHGQIHDIYNGNKDFRVINSLDKVAINPEMLQQDEEYQEFMKYLVHTYLIDYDKKEKNKLNDFVIRLIYRNQNRGYYVPNEEERNEIVYAHAYNLWFKTLGFMVRSNKLGINKENCQLIEKYIIQAIEDRSIDSKMSLGEYTLAYEKVNAILAALHEVAEEEYKLTRKEDYEVNPILDTLKKEDFKLK